MKPQGPCGVCGEHGPLKAGLMTMRDRLYDSSLCEACYSWPRPTAEELEEMGESQAEWTEWVQDLTRQLGAEINPLPF